MKMPLNLFTHNVNGFDRNKDFVGDTCSSLPLSIYGLQEHWLRPSTSKFPGVNALKTINSNLDGWGTSAMQSCMENRIMNGRPFGGTGFVWSKSISSSIRPRSDYRHDRVTVLEVTSTIGTIIIINVYMPYYDNRNIESQIDLYSDTIGFIDSVIDDNPHASIIFMGDMNVDIYKSNNQFSVIMNTFIEQQNLFCTFDMMHSFSRETSYTRCNLKQKSFSLLDYIFVSRDLVPYITDVDIHDLGCVLSDHVPVRIAIDIDVQTTCSIRRPFQSVVDWKSVDSVTRERYEKVMDDGLSSITVPHIVHGNHVCNDSSHIIDIEKYYNDILQCIHVAELQLPHCIPTTKKSYWNDELNTLKK